MTNLEFYAKELLHDAFCAEHEGGSDFFKKAGIDIYGKYDKYDVQYDDELFLGILEWLNQPHKA